MMNNIQTDDPKKKRRRPRVAMVKVKGGGDPVALEEVLPWTFNIEGLLVAETHAYISITDDLENIEVSINEDLAPVTLSTEGLQIINTITFEAFPIPNEAYTIAMAYLSEYLEAPSTVKMNYTSGTPEESYSNDVPVTYTTD